MSAYKFTPRAVASPDAPQKPLVRKRARSGGVRWVQVHEPGSQAKKPRTAGSQQPACTHQEHQILTTAEAASFESQFWDRKVHPTKASQQDFLATCLDVDLEKNVKHPQWHKYTRKRGHQTTMTTIQIQNNQWSLKHCPVLRTVHCAAPFAQKCDHLPPPLTHTFLKRPFLTDFKKYSHTPPQQDEILVHWTKSSSNLGKVPKPTVLAHSE